MAKTEYHYFRAAARKVVWARDGVLFKRMSAFCT